MVLIQVQGSGFRVQGGWTTVVQFNFFPALATIFRALVLLLAFSAMIPAHRNRVSDPVVHTTLMSVAPRSPSHGQMRRLQYTRQPNATAARVLKIKDMCLVWFGLVWLVTFTSKADKGITLKLFLQIFSTYGRVGLP